MTQTMIQDLRPGDMVDLLERGRANQRRGGNMKDPETMTHAELYADSPIKIGTRYRFAYPEEFTSLDDYSAHRGQVVTVLRPCTEDEADVLLDKVDMSDEFVTIMDRMFKVRADDGWDGYAWESELEKTEA